VALTSVPEPVDPPVEGDDKTGAVALTSVPEPVDPPVEGDDKTGAVALTSVPLPGDVPCDKTGTVALTTGDTDAMPAGLLDAPGDAGEVGPVVLAPDIGATPAVGLAVAGRAAGETGATP
jgi:hypothetical protein